jgi:hypothetical protein
MKQLKMFKRTFYRNATIIETIKQLGVHDRIMARELFGSPMFDKIWAGAEYPMWFSGSYRVRKFWYDHIRYANLKIEYEE